MVDYRYACVSAGCVPCYVGEIKERIIPADEILKPGGHCCKSKEMYSSANCQEYEDGKFRYDIGDWDGLVEVNYCPFCGVKAPIQVLKD